MRLKDRVALITGSSRGIGAEIARRLASDGARVVLHAHSNPDRAEAVAATIRAAGGTADIVHGDLATAEAPVRIVQQAFAFHGALDILVCNAAGSFGGMVVAQDAERVDSTLAINLRSPILSVAEFARLTKSPHGRVIVITSGAGVHSAYGASVYGAAKAGSEGFVRSAAQELGERGITVNAVAPGPTVTEMLTGSRGEKQHDWIAAAERFTALRRLGRPEDIADIVAFVASDESHWLTGATLPANGGMVTTSANVAAFTR